MDTAKAKVFLDMMVAKGKITQEQADAKLAKRAEKENVKENYKANKTKMTKAGMQAALDVLCNYRFSEY